jgi:putative membrane protein
MRNIIIHWIITAIAVLVTLWLVPGIEHEGNAILVAAGVAVVLGFVNAIIRPILTFFSCGCIVATLGLFMLVINAITLMLASRISQWLGLGFYIDGFLPALIGSIVISLVSWLLSVIFLNPSHHH